MSTTTIGKGDERLLSFGAGLAHRLRMSAMAFAYVLLAVPALVLLVLVSVSLGVAAVGVGLALLLVLVPLVGRFADAHRAISGRVLGVTIERPYSTVGTTSTLGLLRTWAGDSARWRDYAWLWTRVTVGWALAWVAFGLTLAVVWYAVFPFI